MVGRVPPNHVVHPFADVVKPGVRMIRAEVTDIDPVVHPELTPVLVEDGHEFSTVEWAFALAGVQFSFPGGRVVIGVTSTPFTCPPAPATDP